MPTPRKRTSERATESPRRSVRLSQRGESSRLGVIYPLAYSATSRPSLRRNYTLDESGQSVPPSFENDPATGDDGGFTENAVDPARSHQQKQHDLPQHLLYGLDESDDDVHAADPDVPALPPDTYVTPTRDAQHTSDRGWCQRLYQCLTTPLYMCGSLLYLAATAVLCLDVYLLHRVFRGEPQSKLCRFWVLPVILFALLYFLIGGGLLPGHTQLEPPSPPGSTLPGNHSTSVVDMGALTTDVVNNVTATLRKEMDTFRSELEAHLDDHITKAIASSEQSVLSSVDGHLSEQDEQRQRALKQLKENIWRELNATLEVHWSKLHGLVEQRLRGTVEQSGGLTDSMVQELVTKQLELAGLNSAINETREQLSLDLADVAELLRKEFKQLLQERDTRFTQQLAATQTEMQNETSSLSSLVEDIQDHLETTYSDLSDLQGRVSRHDKEIRALEERQTELSKDIATLKESYMARVHAEAGAGADPAAAIAIFHDELDKMMASNSSELHLWLSQAFTSHEQADVWRKDLETRLKEVRFEGGGLTEQDVKQLIELALDRYSADRIGKFDFALENSGGSVLPASCSKTYTPALGQVSLFGFSLWHFSGSPKVIIQPQVYPGDCWAFEGDTGYATVELKEEIVVTGVTLEHISRDLSPNGAIRSAPKDFTVLGLRFADDEVGVELGSFTYSDSGKPIQVFDISVGKSPSTYHTIQFKFLSNHGQPEYTCVYRVRVHGEQHK